MRRKAGLLALIAFVAPLAAGLAVSAGDSPTARCALACARAGMGVGPGASCCPMGHGGGPSFSSCARDGDAAPVPAAIGPMLLLAALVLPLPSLTRRRPSGAPLAILFPPSRLLDKVPLRPC
ncbi:MAG TPA: hypothetical protein VMH79_12520 [Thermoanaerobaculia bacterium]|nr:hypothetical protein [Thermoanaerobaculia bacterium]